jgi:hypothetical protein
VIFGPLISWADAEVTVAIDVMPNAASTTAVVAKSVLRMIYGPPVTLKSLCSKLNSPGFRVHSVVREAHPAATLYCRFYLNLGHISVTIR